MPASAPVGYYSAQTMREVIAGCKLAAGDERAKAKSCEARALGLTTRIVELTDLGRSLTRWQWLGPVLVGSLTFVLGSALGLALGFGLRLTAAVSP